MPMKYLPVLLLLLLVTGCTTPRQISYDAEVDKLCAKDGGVRIYEKVYIPSQQYQKILQIETDYKNVKEITQTLDGIFGSGKYIMEFHSTYLHGNKEIEGEQAVIKRYFYQLQRLSDGKLLAESASYSRNGGDPAWARWSGPQSRYSCPSSYQSLKIMIRSVYHDEGERP